MNARTLPHGPDSPVVRRQLVMTIPLACASSNTSSRLGVHFCSRGTWIVDLPVFLVVGLAAAALAAGTAFNINKRNMKVQKRFRSSTSGENFLGSSWRAPVLVPSHQEFRLWYVQQHCRRPCFVQLVKTLERDTCCEPCLTCSLCARLRCVCRHTSPLIDQMYAKAMKKPYTVRLQPGW